MSARLAIAILASSVALALSCGGQERAGFSEYDDAGAPATDDDTEPGATNDSGAPGAGKRDGGVDAATGAPHIETVFVILMENHSWATIATAASSATYINSELVPMGAHAEQYLTPPGNHPSEPNYIWLEAGDNLGITNDAAPAANHRATDHLTQQLDEKHVSWKSYAEDIAGDVCPLTPTGHFDPKHTPQLYFDDVTDTNDPTSKRCIEHIRPFTELESDLAAGKVARFNFITPNLCHDMHGVVGLACPIVGSDLVKAGDDWLRANVPKILESQAFTRNGALFVTWDEGDESLTSDASDGPIGMIVLSPLARKGYKTATRFDHSSTLRTFERIFDVPFLRGAKDATDLGEMFMSFP